MTPDAIPARNRFILLALLPPIVVSLATTLIVFLWLPQLPDPVAVHWKPSGPDGFAAPLSLLWLPLASFVVVGLLTFIGVKLGRDAFTRRMCLAVDYFLVVVTCGLALLLTNAQRGLADATDVGDIDPLITIAIIVAIGAAVIGWFLVPADPKSGEQRRLDPSTPHIKLKPTERIVWTRTTRIRYLVPVTLGVAVIICAILSIAAAAVVIPTVVLVVAIVLILEALFTSTRVTIDGDGLKVTLGPGIVARTISANDIEAVDVINVSPITQFGGWGVRTGLNGSTGVITRKGPAIRVTFNGGKVFVVTVDDATSGSEALAAVALRVQRTSAS